MDFRRVKAILLIVFLLLNAFLASQLWALHTAISVYAEPQSDQLANAKSALLLDHVQVNASIPASPGPLAMLRATPSPVSLQTYADAVLPAQKPGAPRWVHGHWEVRAAAGTVTELGRGRFSVVFAAARRGPGRILVRKTHFLGDLKRWFSKHGYNFSEYGILSSWSAHGVREETFAQQYQGYPLFGARLDVLVKGGWLVGFTQTVQNVRGAQSPRAVNTAANALLSLASFLDRTRINGDNTIVDVRLGYYSGVVTDTAWYLAPTWRIASHAGVFYANAFTGEVGVGAQ